MLAGGNVGRTQMSRETYGWVVPQSGPTAGQVYPLGPRTVLGADPDCDVVVPGVARRHVEILRQGDAWHAVALDGASVDIDGDVVAGGPGPLRDGARIRLGPTIVIFKCVQRD